MQSYCDYTKNKKALSYTLYLKKKIPINYFCIMYTMHKKIRTKGTYLQRASLTKRAKIPELAKYCSKVWRHYCFQERVQTKIRANLSETVSQNQFLCSDILIMFLAT